MRLCRRTSDIGFPIGALISFSFIRIWSLSFILILRLLLSYENYEYVYLSFLFGHFALAIFYSRKLVVTQLQTRLRKIRLILFSIFGFMIAAFQIPDIILYFSIHHVLNETLTPIDHARRSTLPRALLTFFVYAYLLSLTNVFHWFSPDFFFAAVVLCYLIVLVLLSRELDPSRRKRTIDLFIFETVGIAVAILTPLGLIRVEDLIFYHVCFWLIFPLAQNWKMGTKLPKRYLIETALVTLFFWLLMPTAGFISGDVASRSYWGFFFGSLHITFSFMLSKWNPHWIRKNFL